MEKIGQKLIDAGDEIAASLFNVGCERDMPGFGGCHSFNIQNYPEKWHDIIQAYYDDKICAVEAIYLAMKREEENGKN